MTLALLLLLTNTTRSVYIDPWAPVPPYPPSPLAPRVKVDAVSVDALHQGDTWPSTWSKDGELLLAGCDNHPTNATSGSNSEMVGTDFFSLSGSPEKPETLRLTLKNASPVTTEFCHQPAKGPGRPGAPWDKQYPGTTNVKSAGMISVGGKLFLGVQCALHWHLCLSK